MNHFQAYLVEEYAEDYQEGLLSRRDVLKLIASVTGSLIAATTILSACAPAEEIQAGPTTGPALSASSTAQASATPAPSGRPNAAACL